MQHTRSGMEGLTEIDVGVTPDQSASYSHIGHDCTGHAYTGHNCIRLIEIDFGVTPDQSAHGSVSYGDADMTSVDPRHSRVMEL